jgi:hypothetical protein
MLLVLCKKGLAGMRGSTQTRLMTYLLFSTAAYLFVLSLHMEHYWNYGLGNLNHSEQWKIHLCETIGLADQYTGTVQLFVTVGVSIHFIYQSLTFYPCVSGTSTVSKSLRRGLEVLLVVVSLVGPALYVWVPFIAVPYGETGGWCWIKTLDRDCNKSFWEQMGIWYIPFGIAAFFSLFAIILFLVSLRRYFPRITRRKRQKKGEAVVLMVFLGTYCIFFLVEFISHLLSVVMKKKDYSGEVMRREYLTFWMLYSLSPPLCGLSLPIGLLIYTYTGTLREAVSQYCTCPCIRNRAVFVHLFRNQSSFTHLSHRPTSDSDSAQ